MRALPFCLHFTLVFAAAWVSASLAWAESPGSAPMDQLPTIASRLRGALDREAKAQVNADFLVVTTNSAPLLRAVKENGQAKVLVSHSMLDLLARLARAKAIDDVKRRYFDDYLAKLSAHTPGGAWPDLPDNDNPRYRKLEVTNGELSNFGQMVGCAVAIELSHAYLGQLEAHQAELGDGIAASKPVKPVLTESEWDQSLQAGVKDAVQSAYGVEGLVAIFQAIEKLPQRPAWADAFLPPNVKPRKAMRDAEKIQSREFGR